ncbi:hypothetical protein WI664_03915 [Vibrio cholerae]
MLLMGGGGGGGGGGGSDDDVDELTIYLIIRFCLMHFCMDICMALIDQNQAP